MGRPREWARRVVAAALAVAAVGCGGPAGEEREAVVATVGDEAITARAFALDYAFGFTHLKQGDDPRAAYLEHMIDEKLLAMEGYRLGLDREPAVRRRVESMREELLVEQVFEREVNDHVVVSDDEIRAAMQQDRVQFKLRYLPAPTLEEARRHQRRAAEEGFDAAVEGLLAADVERGWRAEDFESPYLTWHDIAPAFMEAIRELPVGTVSEPVPYRGSYLVLQVADVRREPVGPAAAPDERARYEQVLFQQKARARAHALIAEMMEPLDVRLKAGPYRALREHLWAWYQSPEAPAGNLRAALERAEGPHADALRGMLSDVVMTTREGSWTVDAFLRAYPVDRYPLDTHTEAAFEGDLYDAFGLTLRDRAFVRAAQEQGLDETEAFRDELARWEEKWVFRELVRRTADTLHVPDAAARAYFEEHRARYGTDATFAEAAERAAADVRRAMLGDVLAERLARLRRVHPVSVRRAVLDTLTLDDPAGPAEPNVVVLKGHTGRPALPVVDPIW